MTVRCKFKLNTVTERVGYQGQHVWDAEFSAVYSEDPNSENKKFCDYTPGGTFKVSTIKQMPWTPGAEYYIDVTPAAEAQARPE